MVDPLRRGPLLTQAQKAEILMRFGRVLMARAAGEAPNGIDYLMVAGVIKAAYGVEIWEIPADFLSTYFDRISTMHVLEDN